MISDERRKQAESAAKEYVRIAHTLKNDSLSARCRSSFFAGVQWADSHPTPRTSDEEAVDDEAVDEEPISQLEEQNIISDSMAADVYCDENFGNRNEKYNAFLAGLAHARRESKTEIERLGKLVDEWVIIQDKTARKNKELRNLLEKAKVIVLHAHLNGLETKAALWFSDYEKLQGTREGG